jgi:hypothetical protein
MAATATLDTDNYRFEIDPAPFVARARAKSAELLDGVFRAKEANPEIDFSVVERDLRETPLRVKVERLVKDMVCRSLAEYSGQGRFSCQVAADSRNEVRSILVELDGVPPEVAHAFEKALAAVGA